MLANRIAAARMRNTLIARGFVEIGGGDSHTAFRLEGTPDAYVYCFDNGSWEIHDFTRQTTDSSAEAQARGRNTRSLLDALDPE